MPNGHGGVVRWGGVAFAAFLLGVVLLYEIRTGTEWTRYVGTLTGALLGWRFSWHLWIYPVNEYGGAYASEESLAAARTLHRVTTAALVPLFWSLTWWLWP